MYFLQSSLTHGREWGNSAEIIYYSNPNKNGTTRTKNAWVPFSRLVSDRIHFGPTKALSSFILEIVL